MGFILLGVLIFIIFNPYAGTGTTSKSKGITWTAPRGRRIGWAGSKRSKKPSYRKVARRGGGFR